MTTTNDGWIMIYSQEEPPPPPTVTPVIIDSYESWVSFGIVEAGKNYHVRFDNFDTIPGDFFGLGNVNNGAGDFSNVQNVGASFLDAYIYDLADFSATVAGTPAEPVDIFAEFTFTADASFEWAGYGYIGMYGSNLSVGFTVTLTEI
jgi:hypothetical protein